MEEQANALGCWAGDLVQMASIFRNYLVKSDTAEQLIGTKDLLILQQFGMTQLSSCGFDYEDWTHDIDAVCLKDSLENTRIDQAFKKYYSTAALYNNRYHTFVEKTIPSNSSDLKSSLYSLAMTYLDPKTLATIGFDILFAYNGQNNVAFAQGFANKIMYYYNLEKSPAPTIPNMTYNAHCQNLGWQEEKKNGEMAGLPGQSLRIEALIINADIPVQYRVHMEGRGWSDWVPNGCTAGTIGESRRIEALEIISSKNVIVGQGHVQNIGDQSEVRGTQIMIGTTGQGLRLEGFRLKFE